MKPVTVKDFKEALVTYFASTRKTGWGKNEIQTIIKDLYTQFLEAQISGNKFEGHF